MPTSSPFRNAFENECSGPPRNNGNSSSGRRNVPEKMLPRRAEGDSVSDNQVVEPFAGLITWLHGCRQEQVSICSPIRPISSRGPSMIYGRRRWWEGCWRCWSSTCFSANFRQRWWWRLRSPARSW